MSGGKRSRTHARISADCAVSLFQITKGCVECLSGSGRIHAQRFPAMTKRWQVCNAPLCEHLALVALHRTQDAHVNGLTMALPYHPQLFE